MNITRETVKLGLCRDEHKSVVSSFVSKAQSWHQQRIGGESVCERVEVHDVVLSDRGVRMLVNVCLMRYTLHKSGTRRLPTIIFNGDPDSELRICVPADSWDTLHIFS